MRRAKQPPPPELINECSVIVDMLDLGRRAEIVECPSLGICDAFRAIEDANAAATNQPFNPERMADWILGCLTRRAMSEYLRLFPKARKPNDNPWAIQPLTEVRTYTRDLAADLKKIPGLTVQKATSTYSQTCLTGDVDYQCFFCRKSLFTRPENWRLARHSDVRQQMLRHAELCAVRLLAGLMNPHPPLPHGQPGL